LADKGQLLGMSNAPQDPVRQTWLSAHLFPHDPQFLTIIRVYVSAPFVVCMAFVANRNIPATAIHW
jgi:hypothetical protein